jgi:hypothetical protein
MNSALRFQEWIGGEACPQWSEDTYVGTTPAWESEGWVSASRAGSIFDESIQEMLRLLCFAADVDETGTDVANDQERSAEPRSSGRRGPKPISEDEARNVADIVDRVAAGGIWKSKLDELGEALNHGICTSADPKNCESRDHEKIPLPRGWKKKHADWETPPDRACMEKAIEERLKRARVTRPPETPS